MSPGAETLGRMPQLKRDGLIGSVEYADGQFDDARYNIALVETFSQAGGSTLIEATAFQTRDVLEAMEKDSGIKLDVLRTDGGMVSDDLLMQFQADILNRPVIRPLTKDATTALGAAYAAGLVTGYFTDLKDLRENWKVDRMWKPHLDGRKRDELYSFWKRAVSRSFDWAA
jgi:glycerol kinase